MTEDTHNRSKPFQPFPDSPHLYYLTQAWIHSPRLLIPKSRQMSVTWLFCALYLWEAIHFPSRLTFFVSKKEESAHDNLERVKLIYDKLPKFYRSYCPGVNKGGDPLTYCRFQLENRSKLIGVPAGPEQLRQYTASGIFSDEAAFQEQLKDSIAAALPTLGHDGRITMVSSAAPSHFGDLVFDTLE